jgi:5-methylcytosine-specific restriction endonuclease McrA
MHYKDFGYDEYDQYLVGPEWRGLNQYFYENRGKYECGVCGARQGLVLHKRSYKFLSLAELKKKYRGDTTKIMRYLHTYMVYLCRTCHKRVHFLPNGDRTPLEYRALKDRELRLKRAAPKPKTTAVKRPVVKSKSFLGSYFKLLKK